LAEDWRINLLLGLPSLPQRWSDLMLSVNSQYVCMYVHTYILHMFCVVLSSHIDVTKTSYKAASWHVHQSKKGNAERQDELAQTGYRLSSSGSSQTDRQSTKRMTKE
jgi:hypothetical protein